MERKILKDVKRIDKLNRKRTRKGVKRYARYKKKLTKFQIKQEKEFHKLASEIEDAESFAEETTKVAIKNARDLRSELFAADASLRQHIKDGVSAHLYEASETGSLLNKALSSAVLKFDAKF